VQGIDVADGTPLLDIKPWFADCDDPRRPTDRPT
jgi:tRNA (Thr-GGU) A37 N-methylase